MTLETGPRDEVLDSVMERVRGFSSWPLLLFTLPLAGTSYGREEGPELPGDATRPATIGEPINEF